VLGNINVMLGSMLEEETEWGLPDQATGQD